MICSVGEWNLLSSSPTKEVFYLSPTGAESWLIGALINCIKENI